MELGVEHQATQLRGVLLLLLSPPEPQQKASPRRTVRFSTYKFYLALLTSQEPPSSPTKRSKPSKGLITLARVTTQT